MVNSADSDQKPTDLDLHCLQRQDISGFSRTRVMPLQIECIFQPKIVDIFLILHENMLWVLI